jgi:hypothetical protein
MFVDFNILNQLGSPSINSNTFANRPAAGQTGRLFVSTDTFEIYRDNGTSWDLIGGPGASTITGTGTATQVAYFTGSQTIGSSANLFWDNTAGALGINTATPGAELDVHGTGIMVQLNSTTATANSLLAFQRSGTGLWRIGDVYNGGTNYFEIFNTVLSTTGLRMDAATNKTEFLAQENYTTGQAQGNLFTYNLTVPGGTTFTSPNAIHSVNSYLNLSLGGSITTPAGTRQGLEGNSRISFTGAGTLTMTQGSTVRAWSSLSSVYSFNGSAVGTITHLAGLRVCFPDNIGSAVNITNNYGLLINDQTAGLGTVNYTNRWGVYQEGASDLNYFNGNLLLGSTTNSGQRLQVTGTALFTGAVTGVGNSSTYTVTAAAGSAISKSITSTLVAAANNDILSGLDINPTFTNGAFTGVSNNILRVRGTGLINFANTQTIPATLNASAVCFSFNPTIVGTANTQTLIGLSIDPSFNTTGFPNSTQLGLLVRRNARFHDDTNFEMLRIDSNGVRSFREFRVGNLLLNTSSEIAATSSTNILFTFNNVERARFTSVNGRFLLNTSTDAGFQFDCNGTARVQGQLTLGTTSADGIIYTTPSRSFILGGGQSLDVFQFSQINNGVIGTGGAVEQSLFRLTIGLQSGAGGDARGNVIRTLGTMTVNTSGLINTFNAFTVNNTINCTAGTSNFFRGFYHNPTLTSTTGLTHRAIETATGDVILGSTSGSTSVGATTTINASAQLQVVSTTKGFLPPVMTGAQAEAIATPAAGLMVYANNGNGVTITTTGWWGYDGATWVKLN